MAQGRSHLLFNYLQNKQQDFTYGGRPFVMNPSRIKDYKYGDTVKVRQYFSEEFYNDSTDMFKSSKLNGVISKQGKRLLKLRKKHPVTNTVLHKPPPP